MKFEPKRWSPPKAPELAGRFASNSALATSDRVDVGGIGPEDVLIDRSERVVVGLENGCIVRMDVDGHNRHRLADTGGRPLGIELGNDDELIICDAEKGLLSLSPNGELRTLVNGLPGEPPFRFTNNATVGDDGTIFFTDSSRHFGISEYRLDLLEHGGTGRLLAYRPSGETEVLLDGLHFPNGVALSGNGDFLMYVETGTYSVSKYWLQGPTAGKTEVLVENLPGFPDNLSRCDDLYWLAIPSLRTAALDFLLPRPTLRRLVARLPSWLDPPIARHGFVVALNADGHVVHNLQDTTGTIHMITGVRQHQSKLFLGNLVDSTIAVLDIATDSNAVSP